MPNPWYREEPGPVLLPGETEDVQRGIPWSTRPGPQPTTSPDPSVAPPTTPRDVVYRAEQKGGEVAAKAKLTYSKFEQRVVDLWDKYISPYLGDIHIEQPPADTAVIRTYEYAGGIERSPVMAFVYGVFREGLRQLVTPYKHQIQTFGGGKVHSADLRADDLISSLQRVSEDVGKAGFRSAQFEAGKRNVKPSYAKDYPLLYPPTPAASRGTKQWESLDVIYPERDIAALKSIPDTAEMEMKVDRILAAESIARGVGDVAFLTAMGLKFGGKVIPAALIGSQIRNVAEAVRDWRPSVGVPYPMPTPLPSGKESPAVIVPKEPPPPPPLKPTPAPIPEPIVPKPLPLPPIIITIPGLPEVIRDVVGGVKSGGGGGGGAAFAGIKKKKKKKRANKGRKGGHASQLLREKNTSMASPTQSTGVNLGKKMVNKR
jgi:hypothetical protein